MKERKEKRKWGLIAFIVFIMIGTTFSFVFFGFSPVADNAKYNGINFENNNKVWVAKINGKEAAFSFLPSEVESVFASDDFAQLLQGKFEIDVTYDVNSTYAQSIALAQYQMGLTMEAYDVYVRKGFTANNSFNIPIIKCEDATLNVPVVYFKYGNATNIHLEKNCAIAEAASNADFIKVKDRILYGMLGVIK